MYSNINMAIIKMMFMLVLMSFGLMLMLNALFTIIIICYICGLSHYIYTYMLLYIIY